MNLASLKKYANVKVIGTVVALILIYIVWENGADWWEKATRKDKGNYDGQPPVDSNVPSNVPGNGANPAGSAARQAELEKFARDTYAALNSTLFLGGVTATGREIQLELLNALNDTELKYVAMFYEHNVNTDGTSLRQDIDDEVMPATDIDERLVARLVQLAL